MKEVPEYNVLNAAYILHRMHGGSEFPLDDLRYFFGRGGAVIPIVCEEIVRLDDEALINLNPFGVAITPKGIEVAEEARAEAKIDLETVNEPTEQDEVDLMTVMWALHSATCLDGPVSRTKVCAQSGLDERTVNEALSELIARQMIAFESGVKFSLTSSGKAWIESKSAALFAKSRGVTKA